MKKIIFNWKMNVNYIQIKEFVDLLNAPLDEKFVFLPSYLGVYNLLANANGKIRQTNVGLQNISAYPSGDRTGAVSFVEAREIGIDYILVNHNEIVRRSTDDQSYEKINHKLKVLIENEFKPIVCLGNEFKEDVEDVEKIISNEVKKFFEDVNLYDTSEIVFVYMPYFYVNNNITVSNSTIEAQMKIVQEVLTKRFGDYTASSQITLIYGGPVEEDIENLPKVDGFFVEDWSKQEFIKKLINTYNGKK